MAFFDEINKRMNGIAQSAQKAAEIVRIQHLINLKQNEYDKLFCEIGKLFHAGRKTNEFAEGELDTLCSRVDSLTAEIEGLNLKLDDLKQIRRCTKCGSVQNHDNRFCAACGEKLIERVIPAQEETVVQDAPANPEMPAQEEDTQREFNDLIGTSGFSVQEEMNKSVFIHWPEADNRTEDDEAEQGCVSEEA